MMVTWSLESKGGWIHDIRREWLQELLADQMKEISNADQMRNQERLLGVVAFTKMEKSKEE